MELGELGNLLITDTFASRRCLPQAPLTQLFPLSFRITEVRLASLDALAAGH